ncbi:MAG TPA: LPS assembly lipoprotein LptE [Bryobacteraceae bacterium]
MSRFRLKAGAIEDESRRPIANRPQVTNLPHKTNRLKLITAGAFAIALACGYHTGGQADLVPKTVQTIAIPAFGSLSTRYVLTDILPREIGREFLSRTRFRIVYDPNTADAILHGTVNTVGVYPTVADPTTNKSTSVRISVVLAASLVERSTGRVLYSRSNWSIHEDYATAVDPHQFFDESGPALDRLSRDVARDIVSAVVENF